MYAKQLKIRKGWCKAMKKAWKKLVEVIENRDYTNREAVMAGVSLFLFGAVVGVFASPKKHIMICSNNGDHNDGRIEGGFMDELDEDEV